MRTFTATQAERDKIREILIRELESQKTVAFAYLHGSFLEGRFRDIDIAAMLKPDQSDSRRLEGRIERRLSQEVGYPVDLKDLYNAPLLFRYSVLAQGELLTSKDEESREHFQCSTLAIYHDFSYHIKAYQREALGLGT